MSCVLVGPFDLSDPSGWAALVYVAAAVHLLCLIFWVSRVVRTGRVLFEFSQPNRKWWWMAAANAVIAITMLLYAGGTSRGIAVLFVSQAVTFGVQGTWGVQARERGLLMPLEFVPWKRVDVCWMEPNHVSVTVRRRLNWDTTYAFTVTSEKQAEIANLLQWISAAGTH